MKKLSNKNHTLLLGLLIITAVLVAVVGFFLRNKLEKKSPTYHAISVIETPFVLMNNPEDTQLLSDARPSAPVFTLPLTNRDIGKVTPDPTGPSFFDPEPAGPVAVYGVDESWFDDALFIGDSRMVGMASYGRLGRADYFADVGLSVFSVLSKSVSDDNFPETTLADLLDSRTYSHVFIMLGINECGYDHSSVASEYAKLIERVLFFQPQAKVYILAVFGVSREKEAVGSYFGPDSLNSLNSHLASLADDQRVFFLDERSLFEDSEGYILDEYTGDGVHLYGKYAYLLSQWLCEQSLV